MSRRFLKGVFLGFLGTPLLLTPLLLAAAYGALLLVNWKDEDLSADAKAFADLATFNVPAEENGFFTLYGWRAPEGADPHAAGIATIDELAKSIRENKFKGDQRTGPLPKMDVDIFCRLWKPDCLETVRTRLTAVELQMVKHETLRVRIRDAAKYRYIHAPNIPYHPLTFPPVWESSELRRLGATESAHAWISGRPAEALALSAERIAIARRVVRDSSSVMHTGIGAVWLRSEYLLLLEFMQRDPQVARAHMAAFEKLLHPLASEDLRSPRWIHGAFTETLNEYRTFTTVREILGLALLGKDEGVLSATDFYRNNLPWWFELPVSLAAPLFQPNATANARLPYFDTLAQAAHRGAKAASSPDWKRTREAMVSVWGAYDRLGWGIYNPIGLVTGVPRFDDNLFRLHDIDRFLRLVALHGALVKGRIPAAGVEAFLSKHSGAIDPVTERIVRWDTARSRLYVDALFSGDTRSESMRIGDVDGQISVEYRP